MTSMKSYASLRCMLHELDGLWQRAFKFVEATKEKEKEQSNKSNSNSNRENYDNRQ